MTIEELIDHLNDIAYLDPDAKIVMRCEVTSSVSHPVVKVVPDDQQAVVRLIIDTNKDIWDTPDGEPPG